MTGPKCPFIEGVGKPFEKSLGVLVGRYSL
jgi:hypothetical protein